MSKHNNITKRKGKSQEEDRRDDVPASEEASTGSTGTDLGPFANWILNDYCSGSHGPNAF